MNKFLIFFGMLIVGILGGMYIFLEHIKPVPVVDSSLQTPQIPTFIASTTFACSMGKMFNVSFYENNGTRIPVRAGEQTIPQGSVIISLGNSRNVSLLQTISADGGRYANTDESFVFWNKGNGALVLENGAEANYKGCVKIAPQDAQAKLPIPYVDPQGTFSLRLPSIHSLNSDGYTVDTSFKRQISSKVTIEGIKFMVPASLATGTNLSSDSYIAVEQILNTPTCTAGLFLDNIVSTSSVTKTGMSYSVATTADAAAGNRYEETIYAQEGTNPCIAVHYFVHYGVFENYPVGSIKEFDTKKLISMFDSILNTLVVNQ